MSRINCVYGINETFRKDFTLSTEFDIAIDGKIVKYNKGIKFKSLENKKVQFIIYGDIL